MTLATQNSAVSEFPQAEEIQTLPRVRSSEEVKMNLSFLNYRTTMSSREIAELTGKSVSHVHRDIRTMLTSFQTTHDSVLNHVMEERDARGYVDTYHLDIELTMTLITGYNAVLRRAVIKRWQELEAKETQAKELAFRKAYNLTEGDYEMIRLLGKEVAAYTALTQQMFAEAYDRVGQLNLPPGKGARMINEVYNHGIARLRTMQRIRDKQSDELAKVSLQVRLAESKALIAEHKLKELNYKKLLK